MHLQTNTENMSSHKNRNPSSYSQTRRSRSRSRDSFSKSKYVTDKYHYVRHRSSSPCCSTAVKQGGSGIKSSSHDIKVDRASTQKREIVPLLPDVESPLTCQLSEPDFPELFGTHLTDEMIWQMEEWRLEAEERFDFSLLLSKKSKDSSKKVSRKRGREEETEMYPPTKRPAIHVNRHHPNFRRLSGKKVKVKDSIMNTMTCQPNILKITRRRPMSSIINTIITIRTNAVKRINHPLIISVY